MQSVLEAIPGVETAREELQLARLSAGFAGRRQCSFAGPLCAQLQRCACLVDFYCCYISALHL